MAQALHDSAANTELTRTIEVIPDRRLPPVCIADNRKVALGGQGPLFGTSSIKDTAKVRLGGQGPIFR